MCMHFSAQKQNELLTSWCVFLPPSLSYSCYQGVHLQVPESSPEGNIPKPFLTQVLGSLLTLSSRYSFLIYLGNTRELTHLVLPNPRTFLTQEFTYRYSRHPFQTQATSEFTYKYSPTAFLTKAPLEFTYTFPTIPSWSMLYQESHLQVLPPSLLDPRY